MNTYGFLSHLRACFYGRRTAMIAGQRLRRVLAGDRALVRFDATKRLNEELSAVLLQYFGVADLHISIEEGRENPQFCYTMRAELIPAI